MLQKKLYVQKDISLEGIKWAFTTFHAANWHPLTWLSHMFDYELYRLNPICHHWTNVEFHIANTLLLFFILFLMTKEIWRSAFVTALFALHPLQIDLDFSEARANLDIGQMRALTGKAIKNLLVRDHD